MKYDKGIKDALREEGVLTRERFETIRRGLLNKLNVPRLGYKGSPHVAYGDRLAIKVEGLPLPALDLYENTLAKEEFKRGPRKLFATFPGLHGPIVVPVEHDPKTDELLLTVPKHAIEGPVTFRFSVKEYVGPLSLMDKLDPSDDGLRASLRKYIHYQNTDERCECRERDYHEEEAPYEHLESSGLSVVSNIMLYPYCFPVAIGSCPLCPYGAIEFDEFGNCSVNVDSCRGQSFMVHSDTRDEAGHFVRGDEEVCWECFSEGDGQYSSRCLKSRLRKVLHVNTRCCGICHSYSRVSDFSDLADVCPVPDVISSPPLFSGDPYTVDKGACLGCMACYENINCYRNDTDIVQDRALRMVAHLP